MVRRTSRPALPVLVLSLSLALAPARGGDPVVIRGEDGRIVLTDRPDPSGPMLRPPAERRSRVPAGSRAPQRVPYGRMIHQAAVRQGLDPALVTAMVRHESSFDPDAVSHAGAMGLMQLMPATARRFGVRDPFDPAENLRGGTRYLRWLLDRFQGDVTLAVAGYHAGEGSVLRHGGMPPYRETRVYVRRVLGELGGAPVRAGASTPGLRVRRQGDRIVVSN